MSSGKKLVAYFSCSGVTAKAAKTLAEAADADLFEIKPKVPYTAADLDWTDRNSRSTVEMKNPASRPEIAERVKNMAEYDVVFVGFPIWWYVAPTIINTFLTSYDFAGKTIVPFFTSGGSGAGSTDKILRSLCPASVKWKPSKRLSGGVSRESLGEWLASLGI